MFEPYYDAYRPGGVHRQRHPARGPAPPAGHRLRPAELPPRSARRRAILLNSPQNPTGKVFSRAELEMIADVCRERDLLAITDEVYEHIVFDGVHVPLASLPGMRDRTVTSRPPERPSASPDGRWASCASPRLAAAVRAAHQFVTYAVATPFQHAMAAALTSGDDYYEELREGYRTRRDRPVRRPRGRRLVVEPPTGTYFAHADIRPLGFDDDMEFCRMLPERVGVAAVPLSAFLLEGGPRHMVRFAFAKDVSTLDEAVERLGQLEG